MKKQLALHLILWTAMSFAVSESFAQATKDKPTLVRVMTKKARVHVGVLQEDDGKTLTIIDLKTRKLTKFNSKDIRIIKKNISDRVAASTVGLPSLVSWQIKQRIPTQAANGKIVSVDLGVAYVTLGQKSGIRKDEELLVFRGEKIIKDPDTGEVIARQRRRVARVKVIEVKEKYCKARVIGDLEIELKVGDGVVPVAKKAIAVLPFTNADGDVTVGGLRLSEELTTWLVKDGLPIVERTKLTEALGELLLQRTGIFDPDTVQKVGKQIGAFAVVSGSIIPGRIRSKVNVRVVEVASGSILYASTVELSRIDSSIAPKGVPLLRKGVLTGGTNVLSQMRKPGSYESSSLRPGSKKKFSDPRIWKVAGGKLLNTAGGAVVGLPIIPEESYLISMRFTRTQGDESFVVNLPVGGANVGMNFSDTGGLQHGLLAVNGGWGVTVRPGVFENGKEYSLQITVDVKNSQADINVYLNEKNIVSWKGPTSALSTNKQFTPNDRRQIGIGVTDARYEFEQIRISKR